MTYALFFISRYKHRNSNFFLTGKYHFNIEEIIDLYTDITEFCNTIAKFKACVDPDDNFLFDLAIQGNTDYLVSGDKQVRNTPIKSEILKIRTLTAFKEEIR